MGPYPSTSILNWFILYSYRAWNRFEEIKFILRTIVSMNQMTVREWVSISCQGKFFCPVTFDHCNKSGKISGISLISRI